MWVNPTVSGAHVSVLGQGPASVLEDVAFEHLLHHIRLLAGQIPVHRRICPQVVEPGICTVVAAEHGVALVPGPYELAVAQGEVRTLLGLLALQDNREVLTFYRSGWLYAEKAQDGGGDIVG